MTSGEIEQEISEIGKLAIEVDGVTILVADFFTMGSCDQLANAIIELSGRGRLLGIYDWIGDDGEVLEDPHLIHAGVLIDDDRVLDIEGISDVSNWEERWSKAGKMVESFIYDEAVAPFEYRGEMNEAFSKRVAEKLVKLLPVSGSRL